MIKALEQFVRPLKQRIFNMLLRGLVDSVDETKGLQRYKVKGLADETLEGLEHVGKYGFASNPPPGAEALIAFLNGERSHGIVIGTEDRRYRFKTLANGEVAIYNDKGDYVHFKANRNIEVFAGAKVLVTAPLVEVVASTKVTLTTPLTEMSANCHVKGTLEVDGVSTLTGRVTATAGLQTPADVTALTLIQTGPSAVTDVGSLVNQIKTKYNSHTHQENGTGGGTTNPTGAQIT